VTLEIRPVRPEEYAAVGELTVEAYDRDGFVARTDAYAARLADVAHRAAEAVTWVAVDDEQPAGILGAVTYCPLGSTYREIAVDDTEAEFRMLAVAPAARGRGVGEALVRRCAEQARTEGMRRLVLSSMARMAAAGRLYRRLGFTPLPDRDWAPHDTAADVVLLAYALDL
jgi:ribosomal protein S18 acetylase RimI-like enzyme